MFLANKTAIITKNQSNKKGSWQKNNRQKVWSIKKKLAKILCRQKILVSYRKFGHFLPTFFTDKATY